MDVLLTGMLCILAAMIVTQHIAVRRRWPQWLLLAVWSVVIVIGAVTTAAFYY